MTINISFHILLLFVILIQVAKATDPSLDCPPATVCYAIDESASINDHEFKQQTDALSTITQQFDGLSPNSTYSAVGFAKTATVVQEPTKNLAAFLEALKNNPRSGGGTSLGAGLLACYDLLKSVSDPRVIVLVTDGMDRIAPMGVDVDDDIKNDGITIATIGVGPDADADELKMIATDDSLYRSIDDFADFSDSIAKIVRLLCKAIPSLSASPSVSASVHPSPNVGTTSQPSVAPRESTSVVASKAPPTRGKKCAEVQCGQCGKKLECYVNSGSLDLDEAIKNVIMSKAKFCTWKRRFTDCGQICAPTTTISCNYGKGFPGSRGNGKKRASFVCSSGKGKKHVYLANVASYRVCIKNEVVSIRCQAQSCPRIGKAYRCDMSC